MLGFLLFQLVGLNYLVVCDAHVHSTDYHSYEKIKITHCLNSLTSLASIECAGSAA